MSFLILENSCIFSSSIVSPSLICCSKAAYPLNSSSNFAYLIDKSKTSGDSYWIRVLLSLSFWGLFTSLNLTMKSESRLRKNPILSINRSRIFSVRWAYTMVGLLRVCLRLLMISMFLFLAYWRFLPCPCLIEPNVTYINFITFSYFFLFKLIKQFKIDYINCKFYFISLMNVS